MNVTASSGVAAAWGIHQYLKYSAIKAHFSWMAVNLGNLDEQVEAQSIQYMIFSDLKAFASLPSYPFKLSSNERFRYYQNVCTPGYTFAFWQWDHWEAHIDWMALNGINLPLAFTAQEAIWNRVYKKVSVLNQTN